MIDFDFSLEQQKKIQHMALLYKKEAEKCFSVGAYLSSCILIGAALEALLLSTINSFPELVLNAKTTPRIRGKIKKLEKWSLGELINVAKEVSWLPSNLFSKDEMKITGIKKEDYFEFVQKTRNLIHPTLYANELGRRKVTKKHLIACFNIVNNASYYLYQSLKTNIGILNEEKERRSVIGHNSTL